MKHFLFSCLFLAMSCTVLSAQGTAADYERAAGLNKQYQNTVFYSGVQPIWLGNTHQFWYVRNTPDGKEYVLVDADKRSRKPLFDETALLKALTKETGKEVSKKDLNLNSLTVNTKADSLTFMTEGNRWLYLTKTNVLVKQEMGSGQRFNRGNRGERYWGERDPMRGGRTIPSPDGTREAYVKDGNVWLKNKADGTEKALTTDGNDKNYYAAWLQWSPDSKHLLTMHVQSAEQRYIHFVESSPRDQLQPKLQKRPYTKPGDTLDVQCPWVCNVETGKSMLLNKELFNHQYELKDLRWNKDSQHFTFEYNQRGHQVYRVLEASALTGAVRCLIEETSDTYVNYNRQYRNDLENGKEIVWMSERDNWNHLYVYDRATGQVKRQITKGEWYVRDILELDEKAGQIWFTANGVYPNEDPYLIRYYRINLDGSGLTCLTPDEGMHTATFSRDRKYLVDVYSKTDMAPIAALRSTKDGKVVLPLEKADISALVAKGWKAPETFVAKGRDGKTDIWGLIYRPSNFDPNKQYPVIEYIYSGPGSHYVPKTFSITNGNMSPLAELGFIVVQLDGMTTSYRSKAFESVCYKNLQDAGFPDRVLWIKAAAEKYPYMDISRVGIFGASAGGQEAMTAVLNHGDFYKAAYSSCGCHDNRMDKIWWNEQWMGYPIDSSYIRASNVVNAYKLQAPLMLVVGELDDNVDPASTMQVVDALIKANKDFELVVLPGVGHTMGGSYGERKRYDFFVKHLLNVTPPAWK